MPGADSGRTRGSRPERRRRPEPEGALAQMQRISEEAINRIQKARKPSGVKLGRWVAFSEASP